MKIIQPNENPYHTKLNGYRASHRNKWYFIEKGVLTLQAFLLLDFYADTFSFDTRKNDYGLFEVNFEALRKIFNCKSDQTIRNWNDELLNKGFIETTNFHQIYKLVCCERYLLNCKLWKGKADYYQELEKNQPIGIIIQSFGLNANVIGSCFQPIGTKQIIKTDLTSKSHSINIISSKCESNVYPKRVLIKQELRTKEEYEKMYKDSDFQCLTPEDMQWVDENVVEKIEIENEEMEQDIVEMYFDGDRDKYKNCLIS